MLVIQQVLQLSQLCQKHLNNDPKCHEVGWTCMYSPRSGNIRQLGQRGPEHLFMASISTLNHTGLPKVENCI